MIRNSSPEACSSDIERLLEWLEEIWLDDEIRETIDAGNWERMIESLKELL